jgi:hypothetical protein
MLSWFTLNTVAMSVFVRAYQRLDVVMCVTFYRIISKAFWTAMTQTTRKTFRFKAKTSKRAEIKF